MDYKTSWLEDTVQFSRRLLGKLGFVWLAFIKGRLFCEKCMGSQVLKTALPRCRFSCVALSKERPANLRFKMNPHFSISQLSRWEHFCLFCICCSSIKGKISFMHPFIFTERDLAMLLGIACINITKLIRNYQTIQIRISFPRVRLAAFSFIFKLQAAWSSKKKKIISSHWAESCRMMKNCCSGKDSQLLFINSDFDRVRENRAVWSEGHFPEDSSRILVLTPSLSVPVSLLWLHIAPFLKSCPSRNQDLFFWKIHGWSYPQGEKGIRGDCGVIHSKGTIMTCPNLFPI